MPDCLPVVQDVQDVLLSPRIAPADLDAPLSDDHDEADLFLLLNEDMSRLIAPVENARHQLFSRLLREAAEQPDLIHAAGIVLPVGAVPRSVFFCDFFHSVPLLPGLIIHWGLPC